MGMEQYKKDFIDFMVQCNVLRFGSFTLKSGRKSPFFMNAGDYVFGSQLLRLGEFYAQALHAHFGNNFDVLFGPAYKGIPLSVATAMAYHKLFNKDIRYCSNRKEEKDHGADKGLFLGSVPKDGDRIVIIEDVTTSGKSIEETMPILTSAGSEKGTVQILGEVVSLDRQEKALQSSKSALQTIKERYNIEAFAIVTMSEVIEHLYTAGSNGIISDEIKKQLDAYYAEWGAC